MSTRLDAELEAELAAWEARGLRRVLGRGEEGAAPSREFASNDYLSLARDPRIVEAARDALARFGVGGRAARLLGGGCALDAEAEEAAAGWLCAEAALLFPTGYQANLGVIGALARRGDAVISDERNHASLIDGASLARARVLVHRHLDLEDVERALRSSRGARRRIVVTESVFSMDGDAAPLLELHALCERHDASLVVDEAHAAALIGPEGAGGWAAVDPQGELARSGRLAARIVTGGKALGASGAFVVGSRILRDVLVQRARSFVFTTALSPAVSGALLASIAISRDAERERVLDLARTLARELALPEPAAAIVPLVVGPSERALAIAAELAERGFDVRAVRPPTVARGSALLRIVCHAHNDRAGVIELALAVRGALGLAPPVTDRSIDDGGSRALEIAPIERASSPCRASSPARTLFVAGTDTGVGKTVVAALLVRAAARFGAAAYWKPVQTGPESDTAAVRRLAGDVESIRWLDPLHELALPASPHEAARAEGVTIELARIEARLAEHRRDIGAGTLVVELAGGLLVPYCDELTQADWLARAAPPLVLVARSGLGTLNHTLLSIEALAARRIAPCALFLVGPRHPSNRATLAHFAGIAAIHEVERFETLDADALDRWIDEHDLASLFRGEETGWRSAASAREDPTSRDPETRFAHESPDEEFGRAGHGSRSPQGAAKVDDVAGRRRGPRLTAQGDGPVSSRDDGSSLVARDARVVWHPYTQHALERDPLPVVGARGALLELADGRRVIDAISSWWTCLHGHSHPRLVAAIAEQSARLDHVLFAGATHEPAVALAEALLAVAPAGLARVFYSDDGSTAVEVALKIAYQSWLARGEDERTVFVALEGGYHGDTFGAMSVGDPDPFFRAFAPLLFEVARAPVEEGAVDALLDELAGRVAAVIVEPLVQGSGGMRMHSPAFLRSVRAACDRHGVPLIADEVMTGFGRTGALFACGVAGVRPDLMCVAKGLTGGMLPLAATLATEELYALFLARERERALFHGHSFTANPIGCAVALASLALCAENDVPARLDAIGTTIESEVRALLGARAEGSSLRRTGGIVAFDRSGPSGYLAGDPVALRRRAIESGVLLRPLGNTIYAMPPACTTPEQCATIARAMAAGAVD